MIKLLSKFRRFNSTAVPAVARESDTALESAMKQPASLTLPAKLLVNYKSTPTSIAAFAVDKAVRSSVDADLLRTIDSAVGKVFYSSVFNVVYARIRNAINVTWRDSVPPS